MVMKVSFKNTWFETLTLEDFLNFFAENFQAEPKIVNMHKNKGNVVLQIECVSMEDEKIFTIFMGEYGFYHLNKNNRLEFNPMVETNKFYSQTVNLVKLLSERNKRDLINNKFYNELMVDIHQKAIEEMECKQKTISNKETENER